MSGICDTCRRKPCPAEGEGLRRCDFHEGGETCYEKLFGTPERAARTLADNCEYLDYCGQCWVRAANCDGKYSTVLEWLRGDAE